MASSAGRLLDTGTGRPQPVDQDVDQVIDVHRGTGLGHAQPVQRQSAEHPAEGLQVPHGHLVAVHRSRQDLADDLGERPVERCEKSGAELRTAFGGADQRCDDDFIAGARRLSRP